MPLSNQTADFAVRVSSLAILRGMSYSGAASMRRAAERNGGGLRDLLPRRTKLNNEIRKSRGLQRRQSALLTTYF